MSNEAQRKAVELRIMRVYQLRESLARNASDAGDLVQQTFFIWATKGHGMRELSKAKSWLFTTLYREFLRGRRRDARSSSLEDLPPGENEPLAQDVDRVARIDAQAAMSALQAVEEPFRAPLTLFYLEDMSYMEIAEALDVPIGTVMSRLSRGKAQLRAVFARAEGPGARV